MDNLVHHNYSYIKVHPIAGAIGAEIQGVNLAEPLKGEVVEEIRLAFLDHLAIFFTNQELTPHQQLAFAQQFGQTLEYPLLEGLPESPQVTPVVKFEHERVNFGGLWHSDTTYLERPPMGSILYAVEVPPYGGDTLFANQYMAYETLSEGLKETLEGLVGINTSSKANAFLSNASLEQEVIVGTHPVVRTHPETGRKALYININHTKHFQGWTVPESRPLLDYLFQHQVRPEFTCRFRWQRGSLAFWDNRCTQHNPVNDYHGFKRIMHRVTLAGDKPYN
ncbi:MAG: taurine dioxygenase [Okeania sp. SIO3C4]|nr:taurine dioxygenase [Okeania sp. SIO3C4]